MRTQIFSDSKPWPIRVILLLTVPLLSFAEAQAESGEPVAGGYAFDALVTGDNSMVAVDDSIAIFADVESGALRNDSAIGQLVPGVEYQIVDGVRAKSLLGSEVWMAVVPSGLPEHVAEFKYEDLVDAALDGVITEDTFSAMTDERDSASGAGYLLDGVKYQVVDSSDLELALGTDLSRDGPVLVPKELASAAELFEAYRAATNTPDVRIDVQWRDFTTAYTNAPNQEYWILTDDLIVADVQSAVEALMGVELQGGQ